jgi:hypothetical protein
MLGWLGAGVIVLLVAVLAGLASLSSVKAQPRGLKLTKIVAVLVLVVGLLLNLAVLVMIIQGQFKLGPTPILAGSLLTVLGLFPVFLAGLTWSLTTVEAVQQFFYPPEEAPAEVPVEVAEEEEVAPVSEEDLERSLGELPTGTSAAPPVSVPGEVIRAELDESLLVRAELDTEAGEIIRAELDEQRILRAELDEERLVRAEPATTTLTGITGPTSDILEAPATPSAVIPAEIDIERIGDTSSRVLERGEVSESPSAAAADVAAILTVTQRDHLGTGGHPDALADTRFRTGSCRRSCQASGRRGRRFCRNRCGVARTGLRRRLSNRPSHCLKKPHRPRK